MLSAEDKEEYEAQFKAYNVPVANSGPGAGLNDTNGPRVTALHHSDGAGVPPEAKHRTAIHRTMLILMAPAYHGACDCSAALLTLHSKNLHAGANVRTFVDVVTPCIECVGTTAMLQMLMSNAGIATLCSTNAWECEGNKIKHKKLPSTCLANIHVANRYFVRADGSISPTEMEFQAFMEKFVKVEKKEELVVDGKNSTSTNNLIPAAGHQHYKITKSTTQLSGRVTHGVQLVVRRAAIWEAVRTWGRIWYVERL